MKRPPSPDSVIPPSPPDTGRPTLALALGSGGARGLAHIPMLEVLDELGIRPSVVAGSSMGAIVGAAHCAGIPAKDLRKHTYEMLRERPKAMARLIEARVGRFVDVFSGLGNPLLVDAERILGTFWPAGIPETFAELQTPLIVVATDYFGRSESILDDGPLRPAVAASMAIPGLIKPVTVDGRVLIDGGAMNPLPFDHLIGRADVLLAIDVAGGMSPDMARSPGGLEITLGTIQIMQEAIVNAKLKIYRPQIVLRPSVGRFRALDFFEAKAIFRAADALKDDLKRELARHFEGVATSGREVSVQGAVDAGRLDG